MSLEIESYLSRYFPEYPDLLAAVGGTPLPTRFDLEVEPYVTLHWAWPTDSVEVGGRHVWTHFERIHETGYHLRRRMVDQIGYVAVVGGKLVRTRFEWSHGFERHLQHH